MKIWKFGSVLFALIVLGASATKAQTCADSCQLGATASYTWNGSTAGNIVQLSTIDNQSQNAAIGFSGDVEISGNYLVRLDLPEPGTCSVPRNPDGSCPGEIFPGFPNQGHTVYYAVLITWDAKQWGTRTDGTQMDGTRAGDSYAQTGNTVAQQWNGTTSISLTVFREMVQHQNCGKFGCGKPFLVDTMLGGSGTAIVTQ